LFCALLLGAFVIGVVVNTSVVVAADAYSVTVLNVPGSISTVASGIDILGRTVGYYLDSAGTHGFLSNSSGFSTINYPGATWTAAYGINASGQIVGAWSAAHLRRPACFL